MSQEFIYSLEGELRVLCLFSLFDLGLQTPVFSILYLLIPICTLEVITEGPRLLFVKEESEGLHQMGAPCAFTLVPLMELSSIKCSVVCLFFPLGFQNMILLVILVPFCLLPCLLNIPSIFSPQGLCIGPSAPRTLAQVAFRSLPHPGLLECHLLNESLWLPIQNRNPTLSQHFIAPFHVLFFT